MTGDSFESISGMMFKDGFPYKTVNVNSLRRYPFIEEEDYAGWLNDEIHVGLWFTSIDYTTFDGPVVGEVAVEAQLYEEAFAIFMKFNLNVQAVNVLLDNIRSIDRAVEFAFRVEEDATGNQDADVYHDLVKYLLMVRKKTKEPRVDSDLIYAYAKIDRLGEIKEFILMPNAKLASTLVIKQFQGAVDAARKANSSKTWKEVCFACVDAEEFHLAQICGLNIIIQAGHLLLVKPYMVAVQSNNVTAVNDALLLLARFRLTYVALFEQIEKHELLETRRVAAYIYKKAGRWKQSIALSDGSQGVASFPAHLPFSNHQYIKAFCGEIFHRVQVLRELTLTSSQLSTNSYRIITSIIELRRTENFSFGIEELVEAY
ncbi:hypothetical protein RHMOL_Rhmol12G0082200 [Rhododendron molle]|uniref:Uncharacterized protein n=1 Tax=Rhododendron molle TaxID=49168 RepID=A0ACC0LGM1_RHOML|nr:hypothetical protein RHMOL_Rhmol12G0082200 [Rhododendron molle]